MMDNNKQTPAPQASQKAKDTWCRMAASLKTLPREIIACLLLSLLIACTVFGVGGYAAGRSSAADASIVAEKKRLDGEYQKLVKQTEEKQDEYNSVLDDWKSAVDTINQADQLESSIDDLTQQKKDLELQVKTAQDQLTALQGKVDEARKTSIGEGVWQVGKDIEAGTYRANSSVGSRCYWEITVGDDIVQNDIPGGGYPEATVSDGQQLKLSNCGIWSKQ